LSIADFDKPPSRCCLDLEQLDALQYAPLDELARLVAVGADRAGAKAITFNTHHGCPTASRLGTDGNALLLGISREVIADSIETVVGAQGFDGRWWRLAAATRTCPGA